MSTSARIDRFRIWLWSNGTSEDIAMFEPAVVESILAVAGRSPVQFAHITAACKRARDTGRDPASTEALGRLLVRSEAPARPAGVKTNAQPKLVVVETVRQQTGDAPRWSAPKPERPKLGSVEAEPIAKPERPKLVSFDAARQQVAATPPVLVETPSSQPETPAAIDAPRSDESPPLITVTIRAATADPVPRAKRPPARKKLDRRLVAGLVVVPVIAAVAFVVRKPSAGGSEPETSSKPTANAQPATTTVLGARLPAGWREVSEGRFVRGDDGDPTHEAYVATVSLDATTDDALLSLARDAERGAIDKLDKTTSYRPIGCEPTGSRTAACRGELAGGLLLQTYVRAGDRRAAVALFIAKLPLADARRETDAIVAALEP